MRKLFLFFYSIFSTLFFAQDGSLDMNFNTGSGPNGYNIMAMGLQTNGKIIVAGDFTAYNGITRKGIARLNSDGSVDESFDPELGIEGRVLNIAIQEDEKIIISGDFTKYNNIEKKFIARLNPDGSLDNDFNAFGSSSSYTIYSTVLQPDGKILIAGDFSYYNGIARGKVARLNSDGTLDQTFDSGIGSNNFLNSVVVQPDGKALIGGYISTYNGIPRVTIARLNSYGVLDSTFNPIGPGMPIYNMTVQTDGKIIVCGGFSSFNNISTGAITRLNSDGGQDISFKTNNSNSMISALILPNGKILANGSFSGFNLVRLNANGELDKGFNTGDVRRMILQPDGKILVCGYFTAFNGVNKKQIVRINGEGILSVSDNEKNSIKIYPNPVKDILHIKNDNEISEFEIYSMEGKKLMIGNDINNSKIDVSTLQKGNYLIKLKSKGKGQTTKFIKE